MYPKLFIIPFVNLPVYSYGVMVVVGFLAAIFIIRHLTRDIMPDSDFITNAALYALIAGIIGARVFYVIHYFEKFRGRWLTVFAVWQGGLELLGGVILALIVIWIYLRRHKQSFRRYADILAIGLMAALAFGRIGCLLNGCCFGSPADLAWSVRFPYASRAYISQVYPNTSRGRAEAHLKLPAELFGYVDAEGKWQAAPGARLKSADLLTEQEKYEATQGRFRCLPVHPTQLYSSLNGAVLAFILYGFWRRNKRLGLQKVNKFLSRPGCVFTLMLVLYGVTRFFIEFLRDDNPLGFFGLTISQNISIGLVILGVLLTIVFTKAEPD